MAVKHEKMEVASGNTPKGKKGGKKNKMLEAEAKGKDGAKGGKGGAQEGTSVATGEAGGNKRKRPNKKGKGKPVKESEAKEDIKPVGGKKGAAGGGKGGAKGGEDEEDKTGVHEKRLGSKERKALHKASKRKAFASWSKETLKMTDDLKAEILARRSGRQFCTLYVRFPRKLEVASVEDVKKAMGDLVKESDIRLTRPTRTGIYMFCYVEFNTPKKMNEGQAAINKLEVEGESFFADIPKEYTLGDFDPLKLHVSGLKLGFTKLDLRKVFATALKMQIPKSRGCSEDHRTYAFIQYTTPEEALTVFRSSKDLKIMDQKVIVSFAKMKGVAESKDESDDIPSPAKKAKVEQSAAKEETKTSTEKSGKKKKAAVVVKEEEKMDDDDDDDEEEEEEEEEDGDDDEEAEGDEEGDDDEKEEGDDNEEEDDDDDDDDDDE